MLKKVCDFKVEDIGKDYRDKDTRPIKGSHILPELYPNVFIASFKNSGKTTLIGNIIKNTCDKDTTVVLFSNTMRTDPVWEWLREYAEKGHLKELVEHDSMYDGKVNLLSALTKTLEEEAAERKQKQQEPEPEVEPEEVFVDPQLITERPPELLQKIRKPRKPKFRAPEYVIILDDLASELRTPAVGYLMRQNRHFRARIIISSQYVCDLQPAARENVDIFIMFAGQPMEKMALVHHDGGVNMPFDEFFKLYQKATPASEPYSFFYFQPKHRIFKKTFEQQFLETKSQ